MIFRIFLLTLLVLLNNFRAEAQSLRAGLAKYKQGDLAGAEQAFSAALRRAPNSEKDDIYLYLSIVRYSKGRKNLAKQNLLDALRYNSYVLVPSNHLRDYDYLNFFNAIKSKFLKGRQAWFVVQNNQQGASKAKVYIKGRQVGTINQKITILPGVYDVEVRATGFERKFFKLDTRAGEETVLVVSLNIISSKKEKNKVMIVPKEKEIDTRDLKRRESQRPKRRKSREYDEYSTQQDYLSKSSRRSRRKKTRRKKSISILNFLPGGIPQFSRNETILGVVYGGVQVAALASWYNAYQEGESGASAAAKRITEANNNSSSSEEDIEAFRRQAADFLDENAKTQQLYQAVFFVGWGVSSIHSMLAGPPQLSSTTSGKPGYPFVKLIEVEQSGRSFNLSQGYIKQRGGSSFKLEYKQALN